MGQNRIMSATQLASPQNTPTTSTWSPQAIWNRLTEPSRAITNVAERRQVRLLRSILVAFIFLGFAALVGSPIMSGTGTFNVAAIAAVALIIVPYFLSGTTRYKIATYMLIVLAAVAVS